MWHVTRDTITHDINTNYTIRSHESLSDAIQDFHDTSKCLKTNEILTLSHESADRVVVCRISTCYCEERNLL